jgi:hypothetical protein
MLSSFLNRIGGAMVSVFVSSAVDRGFESQSGQAKKDKIGICCFCAKHDIFTGGNILRFLKEML